uniref:thiol oxidase n=1 Tax=viral metagenome TaxID=1070528 RepID=A0A6C0DV99_9ZZZZ
MNTLQFTSFDNRTSNKQYYVNTSAPKTLDIRSIQQQSNIQLKSQRIPNNQNIRSNPVDISAPTAKKMAWGEPIWFLFHTLAHKAKEEYFERIRSDLLNHIYSICSNLPCPICSNHAMEYLNRVNFRAIMRKQDLKDLLFVFHNSVNERKGLPSFQYSDLDYKYDSANTVNIIYNFINTYQQKNKNSNMIANEMYRSRQIIILKDWFNKNIQYFDL